MSGRLILAATPIGNLGDISQRLVSALQNADIIYAEDTRHTRKLLNHLSIKKPLRSFHEHSSPHSRQKSFDLMLQQEVVFVSDAGMPVIADPGYALVQWALEKELAIDVIPGPSASITALVISGLPPTPHTFMGFMPRSRNARMEIMRRLPVLNMTCIFFESPHRIRHTLSQLAELFAETQIVVCRELTKIHQECIRGTATAILNRDIIWRGELVLLIAPIENSPQERPNTQAIYQSYRDSGLSHSQAVKTLSQKLSISKRRIQAELQSPEPISTSNNDDP